MDFPYTLRDIETRDPQAVCAAVVSIAHEVYGPAIDGARIEQIFQDVVDMFTGRFVYFQPMDTAYHDLEHTLQTTLCWARLLRNYQRYAERALITAGFFQIGLTAALLHDVGYLKELDDDHGSGAKFTSVHERRSCEVAQIYLSQGDWEPGDIQAVQQIISCTGPQAIIDSITFRHRAEKVLGQMLCTADYLGQMSDPDYLAKLPVLFQEFEESDRYRGIPLDQRYFQNVGELVRRTPEFWFREVLPKLDYDCEGIYRYLSEPYPNGVNPYLEEIYRNLDRVSVRLRMPLT